MSPQQRSANWTPMMTRYTDAYRLARAITRIGETIKIVSLIAGACLLALGLSGTSSGFGGASIFFGVVLAVVVGGVGFILGVLLSAQGQLLTATLDTAVHSCPFLQNEQRAEIMSVS